MEGIVLLGSIGGSLLAAWAVRALAGDGALWRAATTAWGRHALPRWARNYQELIREAPERAAQRVLLLAATWGAVAGLLAYVTGRGPLWILLAAALGMAAGAGMGYAALWSRFVAWRDACVTELMNVVDILSCLVDPEMVSGVLPGILPLVRQPLRRELVRLLADINTTKHPAAACDAFAARIGHRFAYSFAQVLQVAWDVRVSARLFEDLSAGYQRVRELAVAIRTRGKVAAMALIVIFGLLGVAFVAGPPVMLYIFHHIANPN